MAGITAQAPAKLNLHLGIYAQLDKRRYHKADSLMVALDLCDEVEVESLDAPDVPQTNAVGAATDNQVGPILSCDPPVNIPDERNTAYRAAVELAKRVGRDPRALISLKKRVPDQAGMGGSSSDAATVLLLLCQMWGLSPDDDRVVDAARSVGADVPFFLDPVPTLLVGAGDVVAEKFRPLEHPISVALVRPAGPGVSTPAAYAAFDECHDDPADPSAMCALLRSGKVTAEALAKVLHNNLDPVACRLLPAVAEVRSWLLSDPDVIGGQVTGSGSCVFGICPDDEAAARVTKAAAERFGAWSRAAHIR